MIKIENAVFPSYAQMKMVIAGIRNSYCSRDASDSSSRELLLEDATFYPDQVILILGDEDRKLMRRLSKASPAESKYLRMMPVIIDITAPIYWWKQFDTYKIGTTANSESTMHTLANKPIKIEDFSFSTLPISDLQEHRKQIVERLESLRITYQNTGARCWWDELIAELPESYNQKRTVCLNYAVLKNIVKQRRGHKLGEWRTFIDWIDTIPYKDLIFTEGV